MRITNILILFLIANTTHAIEKKDLTVREERLKNEQFWVKYSYEKNFSKDKKLTGLEPRCINVFLWIDGFQITKEIYTEKEVEARTNALESMKSKCYGVLLGEKIEEYEFYHYAKEIELAVDMGLISEDILFYYIHSLGYGELAYEYHLNIRLESKKIKFKSNTPIEPYNKKLNAVSNKRSEQMEKLSKLENFIKLCDRFDISVTHKEKLKKIFHTYFDK